MLILAYTYISSLGSSGRKRERTLTDAREGDTQGAFFLVPTTSKRKLRRLLYFKLARCFSKLLLYYTLSQPYRNLRGISRVRWEFSVLAEGRPNFGPRPKPRAARSFLGYYLSRPSCSKLDNRFPCSLFVLAHHCRGPENF